MNLLENGCKYSDLNVTPKNWKSSSAALNRKWYISYRFYDPNHRDKFPNGRLKIIKGEINRIKSLKQRQLAVKSLFEQEIYLLSKRNYNPILNKFINQTNSDFIIDPYTAFPLALQLAYERLHLSPSTMSDIKSILKGFGSAIYALNFQHITISEVKKRNIVLLLDWCAENNSNFSNERRKKYIRYLSILFNELVEIETLEDNPARNIKILPTLKKAKVILTADERKTIKDHLLKTNYSFYRFLQIFFHSGAREIELLRLRKEDVDLKKQKIKFLVLKKRQPAEVFRPIKNIALPFWEEIIGMAQPNQFLFSKGLVPGSEKIRTDQIPRRWRTHVKLKLGIEADFYSLKHLNLDEITALSGLDDAALLAAHESNNTTRTFYTFGEDERQNERIRRIGNEF